MEAAIRWSPHSTPAAPRFVIVDVVGRRLRLCEPVGVEGKAVNSLLICQRDKLNDFTAFDWSKTQGSLVATGLQTGEATLVNLDPEVAQHDAIATFPVKHQRRCNSIAFSTNNYLATGLDRVRNDCCMNIYDLAAPTSLDQAREPFKRLASSEAIMSIKFFNQQPATLVAGVARQCIRMYDLRDPVASITQLSTRQVHNLAIDPLDENTLLSAGPSGEPVVTVWDRRYMHQTTLSPPGTPPRPVLEFRPVVDTSQSTSIWSLRFSGNKRGTFGVLSSSGEIRVIELAQYSDPSTLAAPKNKYGGAEPWTTRTYARHTHDLTRAWYMTENRHDENSRIIAYDFMTIGNPLRDNGALALHPDRTIDLIKIPSKSPPLRISALDELHSWTGQGIVIKPAINGASIASVLDKLQAKSLGGGTSQNGLDQSLPLTDSKLSSLSTSKVAAAFDKIESNCEAHCRLQYLGFPNSKLSMEDTLSSIGTQRRRCFEGYLFNPDRNKEIVASNPWLVELWDTVQRFQELANDNGMTMDGIDISYLGIHSILTNSLGAKSRNRLLGSEKHAEPPSIRVAIRDLVNRKGYPPFIGVKTAFPEHRQLCLALCGWSFHQERMRARALALVEQGDCYKAIALCVFRGYRDLALELLKIAMQQKRVPMIGLGAIIVSETVNADQRELCQWMSDETDDPYLKSLLEYFCTGDWASVARMRQLPLIDRVTVALKHFDDVRLNDFVKLQMSEAIVYSNIEGVILTGLVDKAVDLFEHYVRKYNDIQTAVLVMAHSVPMYLSDDRFEAWKETYFMQMQAWKAFTQRTRFSVLHNRMSVTSHGRQFVKLPERQLALRCLHCQQSIAYHPQQTVVENGDSFTTTASLHTKNHSPSLNAGTLCPQCKRPMPRCGICMLWLGSPDPARPGGAAALADKAGSNVSGKVGVVAKDAILIEKMIVWCMKCSHGFHGGHAREWFSRHKLCAVPDCECVCGVLH